MTVVVRCGEKKISNRLVVISIWYDSVCTNGRSIVTIVWNFRFNCDNRWICVCWTHCQWPNIKCKIHIIKHHTSILKQLPIRTHVHEFKFVHSFFSPHHTTTVIHAHIPITLHFYVLSIRLCKSKGMDFLASSLTAKVFTSNSKEIHFENFVASVGAKKSDLCVCSLLTSK